MVYILDRIILAVGKHIVPKNALPGRYKGICGEESAELGIVIAGLKVIKTEAFIVYIAAIAERIMQTQ